MLVNAVASFRQISLVEYGPYWELFKNFERIREAWGQPIVINSGYRCKCQ